MNAALNAKRGPAPGFWEPDPSGRKPSDPGQQIKAEERFGGKEAEEMKAESRVSVLESKIRACGGGRCGRADRILSGRRAERQVLEEMNP